METDVPNSARSLRSAQAVALRREMLRQPHIAPLTCFVEKLKVDHPSSEFPYFDPLDGGSCAEILFLFEKPGRLTSAAGNGSGFISRDNNDPTAEATFNFMKESKLRRKHTVLWNVVPGWNGVREITTMELKDGVDHLKALLPLLPELRTIVLVGKKAQRAKPFIEPLGVRILASAHPSPLVRASRPAVWSEIPSIWAQAF